MSNFLFYSDYVRFINDLNLCRDLNTVASLMKDFSNFYVDYNPSFFDIFLDVLWKEYPEYDLEFNSDLVFEFDEEKFNEYSNPRMEFVGQYLYYLADENFENELSKEETNIDFPYDFSEEAKFTKKETDISLIEMTEANISFGIKKKHACNLSLILENVNSISSISNDDAFVDKMTSLFTTKDIHEIPTELKVFHLRGKTNVFVYLLDELKATFLIKFEDYFFDKYCVVYTQKQKRLTSTNIQSARNRNTHLYKPQKFEDISDICKLYSPSTHFC